MVVCMLRVERLVEADLSRGAQGAAAWRGGASAHTYEGPRGTTVYHGSAAARGAAVGPGGAVAGGRYASGTAVEGPHGNTYAHETHGGREVAAGPNGVAAGRQFSSGTAVRGAGGATVSRSVSGRAYAGVYGTHAWSPTYFHAQAVAGRRWLATNPIFTPVWTAGHPWAWRPAAYTAGVWAAAIWRPVAWSALDGWLGWGAVPYYAYQYGDNITYQDGNVYYGSQPVGTAQQYYQEAVDMTNNLPAADSDQDGQWLPLGVFGVMPTGQKQPQMVFQLAVNKSGTIRGNCYEPGSKESQPVQGSVDKKTQRAVWTAGDQKGVVVETGLYNLTKDESTALVHLGPDHTEQEVLVRMKQPEAGNGTAGSSSEQ